MRERRSCCRSSGQDEERKEIREDGETRKANDRIVEQRCSPMGS